VRVTHTLKKLPHLGLGPDLISFFPFQPETFGSMHILKRH